MRAVEFLIAAGVRTLEEMLPGFTERFLVNLQEHATADEVIRLRGPRAAPEVLQEHAKAITLGAQMRLINIALGTTAEAWEELAPKDGKRKKRRA